MAIAVRPAGHAGGRIEIAKDRRGSSPNVVFMKENAVAFGDPPIPSRSFCSTVFIRALHGYISATTRTTDGTCTTKNDHG